VPRSLEALSTVCELVGAFERDGGDLYELLGFARCSVVVLMGSSLPVG
jgi:hypothetical protein